MASIIAFFTALPAIVTLLGRLGDVMDRFMKWSEHNNIDNWITDLEHAVDKLENAKTPAEKLDAARDIVNSIRSI